MSASERIKGYIGQHGPVIPVQIAKELQTDIIIASAHLSELVSNKQLKISSIKIGGSPLYYLPGQEKDLQKFSDRLHEKEKRTYDLLLEKGVLRDNELDPVSRVTIKNIKDFAVPLQVNHSNRTEVFWKWYLLPKEDAEKMIRKKLGVKEASAPKQEQKKLEQSNIGKEKSQKSNVESVFFKQIEDYFRKNNIKIKQQNIIRKDTDFEFTVELPSSVGGLDYYCKAKSKKKINDGDLSSAFIKGQSKKLPVLFLIKGDLTKKAKEMLGTEFQGMRVRKI